VRRITTALVAALAAAATVLGPAAAVRADTTAPPITVQVGATTVGRPIAPGFVGVSVEFPAIRTYTGLDPTAINPVFVQLVKNLAPGEAPVVRIGGNSTDATWIPARGVHPTPGIHSTITPRFLAIVRNFAQESRARLIMGLNLKLNSASEIAAEAHAYLTGIGAQHIEAFEIGNEPELYRVNPWYTTPSGTGVFSRRPGFGFKAYTKEIAQYADVLKGDPLAGPATGNSAWLSKLPKVFKVEPGLKVITYHRYPLIRCGTVPGDPNYPSIPNLLSLAASRGLLTGEGAAIAYAHSHGATFRLDELNTVACKGFPGVSDTFASALWVLDTLFSLARSGVDGVNIHTLPEAYYRLFGFTDTNGHWTASVKPEYYGLLMFGQAAPPGSRLLSVTPSATPDVREWATKLPDGEIHVVLINDSTTTSHQINVQPPSPIREALLETMTAPSVSATSGVTLGGQTFGDETSTGTLSGTQQLTPVTPSTGGQYQVTLAPGSAVMLALAPASS
jgi:Glycosyl hydrolase family 79 C-terminal beta domain